MFDSTLTLPNVTADQFRLPSTAHFSDIGRSAHAPRILLLYGSVRQRSYSRLLAEEAARLLNAMGAETRFFNPSGLPLPDDATDTHPKVRELRELTQWSEGMVWSSPERHGAMSGIMKAQIDWIPLSLGSVRPTQGKTLAVMQVSGGSQSFNAVSQMRILGRWMRMITIPNQSSVAKAYQEFDEQGRMKPSAFYDRVVDVMEELVKFTLLTRDVAGHLVDRYSERKDAAKASSARTLSVVKTAPAVAQACCGGPPKTNAEACCAKDEKAKAEGKAGCGCSTPQLMKPRERCCA
jgi:arsenical resistance protein ArsH